MNNPRPTPHRPEPTPGISMGDIYYVVFRHKWKILILTLAGLLAAVTFNFLKPPPYQSQAELLIQYVPQAGAMPVMGSDQKVIVPDARGDDVINSEIQIMTSLDLAEQAVTNIGAAGILAKYGGGSDPGLAAAMVWRNLTAEPADHGSSVVLLTYKHPDPGIVQPVLRELINDYFQRHREIHSVGGQFDDALSREVSTLSLQLNDTEQQLASLKNRANIISLDDSRKDLSDQISKIRGAIVDAQAELAGEEAAMKQAGGTPPGDLKNQTNAPAAVPPDQLEAYNALVAGLDGLRKKEQDYLLQGYTKSNALVLELDGRMAEKQKARDDLKAKFPQLADAGAPTSLAGVAAAASSADLRAQAAQVATLQARLKAWDAQLIDLQMQATNLNALVPTIAQLEQTMAIQEANYKSLATGIEKSHIDQALDTGSTPNIKWVQNPSPPFRDWKLTHKLAGMLAVGGLSLGLAWAFMIELLLDRTVRRPGEVESKLKMLLFLAIPDFRRNGPASAGRAVERPRLLLKRPAEAAAATEAPEPVKTSAVQVVSQERDPAMYPFCEALRDRLIVYFEVRNLTHKPKLVAVTSANRGAGVSSIAAGLAASLSETGDGNVLLVDMTQEEGAAQQFYKGKASCGLDRALQMETKSEALVQQNLYVVNGNSLELPSVLPNRFAALVPRLKASDYDYIIFDLPAVSQTSITSRLARFMDMVLLVVESEKSDREVVQQANNWLLQSGATVGAVLNKSRQYIPEKLQQDFLNRK